MATAADGTHPTGMHSCCKCIHLNCIRLKMVVLQKNSSHEKYDYYGLDYYGELFWWVTYLVLGLEKENYTTRFKLKYVVNFQF